MDHLARRLGAGLVPCAWRRAAAGGRSGGSGADAGGDRDRAIRQSALVALGRPAPVVAGWPDAAARAVAGEHNRSISLRTLNSFAGPAIRLLLPTPPDPKLNIGYAPPLDPPPTILLHDRPAALPLSARADGAEDRDRADRTGQRGAA